jgi:hypothetical protein
MKVSHKTAFGDTVSWEADVKETVSALIDRCRGFFGKDAESVALLEWLERRTAHGAQAASFVWVVGMRQPLPLGVIYQPTHLQMALSRTVTDENGRIWGTLEPQEMSVTEFLKDPVNSIVTAGAGFGKTTFMHSLFKRLASSDTVTPLLFTLRESDEIKALEEFVSKAATLTKKLRSKRLLVLADGYDEISTQARLHVSSLLNELAIEKKANYVLTCRDHYDIYMLTDARRVQVSEFTREDQITFMQQYFQICERSDLDRSAVEAIYRDLGRRNLIDLLKHPLLLTLACITKADTPGVELRGSADLIESALNALAFRWDQQKGGAREPTTPLNGTQRQTILRKLAYAFDIEPVSERRAVDVARVELERFGFPAVEPLDVLREIAQFYGMFVQIKDKWGFVHRPIHDYLAAQHAVRNGLFAQQLASDSFALDSRTAYAAVLSDYATETLLKILHRNDQQEVVRTVEEILLNEPSFDVQKVWLAMVQFTSRQKPEYEYDGWRLKVDLRDQFITAASSRFLQEAIRLGCSRSDKYADTLVAYAVAELQRRRVSLTADTYAALLKRFNNKRMTIQVMGFHPIAELPHDPLPNEATPSTKKTN